jgi:4-diphosphocytidyl-2-C-methyl-D-erythritol kinase
MTVLEREHAYAKINLCLFLGPTRPDGRHLLVTLFDSVRLADELVVTESADGADHVVCDRVSGSNLVADALTALRATGWAPPRVTVTIDKRIPIAAGMGGGSADAAAMLRCAPRLAPVDAAVLVEIAAGLGADVPGQLRPGPSLGTGAGELIDPLGALAPYGVLVIPRPFALSTPAVYREADRLGLPRSAEELAALHDSLVAAIPPGPTPELIVNDLQPAALSLAPQIDAALDAARGAGADHVLVCGSGPTVIGVFDGTDGERRAAAAATALSDLFEGVLGTGPVDSSQFVALA